MSYTQTPLPYEVNALEPVMDAETLSIHYGKHHATYTKNLNAALEKHPEFTAPPCPGMLLRELNNVPQAIFNAVRNFGGGHVNHAFFWKSLRSPRANNVAVGKLAAAIEKQFGSFQAFREAFTAAANGLFGSGWTWLVLKDDGSLAIATTPNQDSPFMPENLVGYAHGKPLLALDLWEHSYYLRYRNVRADFVNAFWEIIDWDRAEKLFNDWNCEGVCKA